MRRGVIVAGLAAGVLLVAIVVTLNAARQDREYRRLVGVGEAALAGDQTFEAIEAFSGALAFKSDSMLAYLKRGDAYRRRGELKAALRDLREAADLDRSAPQPLELLGDVNMAMKRYERAAEEYRAFVALDDRAPRVLYKLGVAYYRNGQTSQAVEPLRRALAIDERLPEAHYALALCLREGKRPAEAQRALNRAIELNPAFAPAREELADLYSALGRPRQSIDQLEALAALEPSKAERLIRVALAYADTGRGEAAAVALARAVERFPDAPGIDTALGRVWLARAEDGRDVAAVGKALEALAPAASRPNASSETLTLYGRALMLWGDLGEAERTLQRASTRMPVEPNALLDLATAAQARRHLTVSRNTLIQYATLFDDEKTNAVVWTRIADLSMQINDVPAAVRWAERAVEADSTNAAPLGVLAAAQYRLGRRAAARDALRAALSRAPQDPTLLRLKQRIGI